MVKLGFDLILLGAPAAGKDTQANLLKKRYGLHPIESGKYWRKMAAQNNSVGELLRKTFGKGHAAPVYLMKDFLNIQIAKAPKNRNLLFIGNPRLKPEAQLLVKLLKAQHRDFLVISITIPETQIKKRSLIRRRDEQDWKYLANRIKMYKMQVSKTLNYFKQLGKMRAVNGNQTVNKVASDIEKIINVYQRSQTNSIAQRKRPHSG